MFDGDALMVADHLGDDKVQEFFGKFGVKAGFLGHGTQTPDLGFFTPGVSGGQVMFSLEDAHPLGGAEPFSENMHKGSIEVVDGAAHGK